MLEHSDVAARLPAQDLKRAKAFYADKPGPTPSEVRPGGLRYRCGNGWFSLFESSGRPSGTHTQLGWEVENIEAEVAELRGRGVVFEEYDLPGLKTVNGNAELAGNYPSQTVSCWIAGKIATKLCSTSVDFIESRSTYE